MIAGEKASVAPIPTGAGAEKRVVIVGNGASLLGGRNGAWIDQHDVIVRFNLFQTERYEQDVGTRTTIWFNNRDAESPVIQKRLRQHTLERIYVHTWVHTEKAVQSFQEHLRRLQLTIPVAAVDAGVLAQMTTYLGRRYSMFSTGAIGAWLMLQEFRLVTLIGFDWWQASEQFHYCDNAKFIHNPRKGHQPQFEKLFFDKLVQEKRVLFHPQQPAAGSNGKSLPAQAQPAVNRAEFTGSREEWAAVHQPWELRYHQGANFRWPQFEKNWSIQWNDVFGFAEMSPQSFGEKDVLFDVGCGSRPVLDFFTAGQKFFLDPLLDRYVKIPPMEPLWKSHEASHRFAQPAEDRVEEMVGKCDFVLCWNVLDHSHDPFRIVEQIRDYAKIGAKVLIGTDLRERAHLGHPGIRSKAKFLKLIEENFRILKNAPRNSFPTCLDIALLLKRV